MVNTSRLVLGKAGEDIAASYLEKKGFILLSRNFRSPFGEVDLICKDKDQIVFVEVKTRTSLAFGDGAEAVDKKKMGKIIRCAGYFLKLNNLEQAPYRFDVVSILSKNPGTGHEQILHIPAAFP